MFELFYPRRRRGCGCGCLTFVVIAIVVIAIFAFRLTSISSLLGTGDTTSASQPDVAKVSDPAKATPDLFNQLQTEVNSLKSGTQKSDLSALLAKYADEYKQYISSSSTSTNEQKASAANIAALAHSEAAKAQAAAQSLLHGIAGK